MIETILKYIAYVLLVLNLIIMAWMILSDKTKTDYSKLNFRKIKQGIDSGISGNNK